MNLEKYIENYIDEYDPKATLKEEIHLLVKEEKERILSNVAYHIAQPFVESCLSSDDIAFVKAKVKKILNDEGSIKSEMFSRRTIWDAKDVFILNDLIVKTMRENESLVKEKVIEAIKSIDQDKLHDLLLENFDIFLTKLFERNKVSDDKK